MLVYLFLDWIGRFFSRSKATPVVMPSVTDEQAYIKWYSEHVPHGLTAEEANYINYLESIGLSYKENNE